MNLDELEARARRLPDDFIVHEGDCCGSLCTECGHCLHSIDECDHECDPGSGCRDALPDPEVDFRQGVLALIAEARAARRN